MLLTSNRKSGVKINLCISQSEIKVLICMYRLKKYRAADTEMKFPDEIETPVDVAARVRFQK